MSERHWKSVAFVLVKTGRTAISCHPGKIAIFQAPIPLEEQFLKTHLHALNNLTPRKLQKLSLKHLVAKVGSSEVHVQSFHILPVGTLVLQASLGLETDGNAANRISKSL